MDGAGRGVQGVQGGRVGVVEALDELDGIVHHVVGSAGRCVLPAPALVLPHDADLTTCTTPRP